MGANGDRFQVAHEGGDWLVVDTRAGRRIGGAHPGPRSALLHAAARSGAAVARHRGPTLDWRAFVIDLREDVSAKVTSAAPPVEVRV